MRGLPEIVLPEAVLPEIVLLGALLVVFPPLVVPTTGGMPQTSQ